MAMLPKKQELEEGGASDSSGRGTLQAPAPVLKKRCRSFDL